MKYFALVLAGLLAVLILGCSDDDPGGAAPAATPEQGLTAEEVLSRAAEASAQVSSFHFVLTHENGSTPLPINLQLESAEGDVTVPDGFQAQVEASAAGINVEVEVIGVEGRTWVTNPFTRGWQELDGANIQDYANPEAIVSGLLPAIQDAELQGETEIEGVQTRELSGTIDSAALQETLGLAEPGHDVRVEAWVGIEDNLPHRVRLIGPLTEDEPGDIARQVDLSAFNQPVSIEPPE